VKNNISHHLPTQIWKIKESIEKISKNSFWKFTSMMGLLSYCNTVQQYDNKNEYFFCPGCGDFLGFEGKTPKRKKHLKK